MRALPLLALLVAGCGQSIEEGPEIGVPIDMTVGDLVLPVPLNCNDNIMGDAGYPATFQNVEVIFDNTCGTSTCHYENFPVQGGFAINLNHGHAYDSIVGKMAPDPPNQCGGNIVTPFRPDQSYILVKLTKGLGQQCNPQGGLMPVGEPFSTPLPDCQIDLIRRWILSGAQP